MLTVGGSVDRNLVQHVRQFFDDVIANKSITSFSVRHQSQVQHQKISDHIQEPGDSTVTYKQSPSYLS